MMAIYGVLLIVLVVLTVQVVLPAASLAGCAAIEASLMKKRPQLSWVLPAVVMLASALIQRQVDGSSGLEAYLWSFPARYVQNALSGTAAGAVIGAVLRWFSAPKELNPA